MLDTTSDLSHSRRLAITSIKERIDQQADTLVSEENKLKDQCDYYRRKEDKLRVIKQKVDIIEGHSKFDDGQNHKDALMKEVQADYGKYIEMY